MSWQATNSLPAARFSTMFTGFLVLMLHARRSPVGESKFNELITEVNKVAGAVTNGDQLLFIDCTTNSFSVVKYM